MVCYYHPDREGTDTCAICGKNVCKECGLEIAGKVYCKDCLEKIVGIGVESTQQPQQKEVVEEVVEEQVVEETPYDINEDELFAEVSNEIESMQKEKVNTSPYDIKSNINIEGGLESSYLDENEIYQAPQQQEIPQQPEEEAIYPYHSNNAQQAPSNAEIEYTYEKEDVIYPDHSYEPKQTSASAELEDKYEKYLDDLYFDEKSDIPLNQQLAKDEAQYGSLTRKPYSPTQVEPRDIPEGETPEQMEARIRAEILREKGEKPKDGGIHQLSYKEDKNQSYGAVDILLSIILVIVILIVIYYIIYMFFLVTYYPTFFDALYGLTSPQTVINNLMHH